MGQSLENQINIKKTIEVPGNYTGKADLLRLVPELVISDLIP